MRIARFWADRAGAAAVLFAAGLLILMLAAGAAIDYVTVTNARSKVQEAADAAVIAAVRAKLENPAMTDDQLQALASNIFSSHVDGDASLSNIVFTPISGTNSYSLTADINVPTSFLAAAGVDAFDSGVSSEATVTPGGPVEVVMVLDNTGSMDDNDKIEDLKTAANILLNGVMSKGTGTHKFGLVPFAEYVNIGAVNAGQSWVSAGLYEEDGDSTAGAWYGCVGSRANPLDIQDSGFATTRAPRINVSLSSGCPAPIQPLTTNISAVQTQIAAMNADGATYIPAGLMWGLRVISDTSPYTEGMAMSSITAQSGIKAIVLLTDGENTRAPTYPGHEPYSNDDDDDDDGGVHPADALTADACNAVKAAGIRLYTVAFDVNDTALENLLAACASTDGGYFDAQNTASLTTAFGDIANDITDIVISR